jgi:hypothetical protein
MCTPLARRGVATQIRVSDRSGDMISIICRRTGLSYALLKEHGGLALH